MMDIIINCLALYGFFSLGDYVSNKFTLGDWSARGFFEGLFTALCSVGTIYIVFTVIKHY